MAKLSSLIVDLQVNSAAMRAGLDKANNKLTAFGKAAQNIGKLVAASFAFNIGKQLVQGLAHAVTASQEAADKLTKLGRAVGVPVDALSRLDYAASFAGVSTDDLGTALNKMNKVLGDASKGTKEQVELFKGLGITIHDNNGTLKTSEEILREVADKFSKVEDGAAKSALAQELFGKSGAKMITLLNGGSEGLRLAAAEAEAFGLVLNDSTGQAAERFNDSLARIGKVVDGLTLQLSADIAPAITTLAEAFTDAAKEGGLVRGIVDGLGFAFKVAAVQAIILVAGLESAWTLLVALAKAGTEFTSGAFDQAGKTMKHLKNDLEFQQKSLEVTLAKMLVTEPPQPPAGPGKLTDAEDFIVKNKTKKKEKDDEKKTLRDFFADMDNITDTWLVAAEQMVQAAGGFGGGTGGDDMTLATSILRAGANQRVNNRADQTGRFSQFGLAGVDARSKEMLAARAEAAKMKEAAERQWLKSIDEAFSTVGDSIGKTFADIGNSLARAGLDLVSKMGRLGSVINGAISGAQEGGVVGAVVAVMAELFSMSTAFDKMKNIGEGMVETILTALAPTFELLANALGPVLGGVGLILANALQSIAPLFQVLADVLAIVAPFLALVGVFMKALAPILQGLATILSSVLKALEPVFKVVFTVAKFVLAGVLLVMAMVFDVWNGILGTIAAVVDTVVEMFSAGTVKGAGGFLRDMQVDTSEFSAAITSVTDLTWDQADAMATENGERLENVGALNKLKDSANALTQSLTNVPRGFRVEAARFAAGGGGPLKSMTEQLSEKLQVFVTLDGQQIATSVIKSQRQKDFLTNSRYRGDL